MIERYIQTALTTQITGLLAKPERLTHIFGDLLGLPAAEVTGIETFFKASPPSVILQYPREDSPFPLYSIVLRDETETDKALADLDDIVDAEAAADFSNIGENIRGADMLGTTFNHTFHIITMAKHRDVCVYYFALARYFMMRARGFFVDKGLYDLELGGGDLAPDQRYLPAYLFARILRFRCGSEFRVIADIPPQAFKIDGVYTIGGSASATGVTAGVTVKPKI